MLIFTKKMAREGVAMWGFVERNFNLVKRYMHWEVVFLVYTLVNTVMMGLIAKHMQPGEPDKVLFMVIGALSWSFLSVLFHDVAESIAWERWEGTIEYTFMAPIRRITMLLGQCAFGVIYGVLRTILVFLIVSQIFEIRFDAANFTAASLVLILGSVSFLGMGVVAAVLPMLSPERGPQATHILQAVVLLVSGVYYPISVLPAWLQKVSTFSPGTYALRSMRAALIDGVKPAAVAGDLGILAIFAVVTLPVGYWIFMRVEKYAKRKGLLKRSG